MRTVSFLQRSIEKIYKERCLPHPAVPKTEIELSSVPLIKLIVQEMPYKERILLSLLSHVLRDWFVIAGRVMRGIAGWNEMIKDIIYVF